MIGEEGLHILKEAKQMGLYPALAGQLSKDFSRANVDMKFDPESLPGELAAALHEKLYQLLMERFSDYLNVLYMIDVPEGDFRRVVLTDAVEIAAAVSVLVIKREWEKVRMKHSSE